MFISKNRSFIKIWFEINYFLLNITIHQLNTTPVQNLVFQAFNKEVQGVRRFSFRNGSNITIADNQFLNLDYGIRVQEIAPTSSFDI